MSQILISKFASLTPEQRTIKVQPPLFPLTTGQIGGALDFPVQPTPARKATYKYALADALGRRGPWSPEVTFNHPPSGGIFLRWSDFAPTHPECVGYYLSVNNNLAVICENGVSPQTMGCPFLWAMPGPKLVADIRRTDVTATSIPSSPLLNGQPPVLRARAWNIPNVDLEVAESYFTPNGETDPGPWVKAPKIPGVSELAVVVRTFYSRNEPPPGVLYRRLYGRVGSTYYRLGDFPHDSQTMLATTAILTPPPTPTQPQVELCPLQMALNATRTGDVVIVDVAEVVSTVPIVDSPGDGNEREGVNVISQGQRWKLNAPGLVMRNRYNRYEDCWLTGPLMFADATGGQAFGVEFYRGVFEQGMRVLNESSSSYQGHTASELYFAGSRFFGPNPIHLDGVQTADVRFERTHANSDTTRKHGTAPIWIDTACRVFFDGGLYLTFGHCGLYLGAGARVHCTGAFDDQGHDAFIQSISYYPSQTYLTASTLNPMAGLSSPWLYRGSSQTVEKLEGKPVECEGMGAISWRSTVVPVKPGPIVPVS